MEKCRNGCAGDAVYTQKTFKNGTLHYCRQCERCCDVVKTEGKYWIPAHEIEPQVEAGLIVIKPFATCPKFNELATALWDL